MSKASSPPAGQFNKNSKLGRKSRSAAMQKQEVDSPLVDQQAAYLRALALIADDEPCFFCAMGEVLRTEGFAW